MKNKVDVHERNLSKAEQIACDGNMLELDAIICRRQ